MNFGLSIFINLIKHYATESRTAYIKEEITIKELDSIINNLQVQLGRIEGF